MLLRLEQSDGRALLAAKEAVNTAQRLVARIQDFDELIVTDTANANTVANQANYHIANDWTLTRAKDILSIRLMSNSSSRKLTYVSPRELDEVLPYVDQLGTQKSGVYTQRGKYIELVPIPNGAYPCYIMHSQWPSNLANDSDETDYEDIDDVIIELAAAIADDILNQRRTSRESLARDLLMGATREEHTKPDQVRKARPFNPEGVPIHAEYWKVAHWKHNP